MADERPPVVADVQLRASTGRPLHCYTVTPRGTARAGVVFLHWYAPDEADGNRGEFLEEAGELAAVGIASILPAQRFPWEQAPHAAARDLAEIKRQTDDLVHATAYLRDAIAPGSPLAAVGHDFGAMYAALLTARLPDIAALVFIAGVPRWADWFLPFWVIDEDRYEYQRLVSTEDPVEHLRAVPPRPMLLQFSKCDFFVSGVDRFILGRAAGETATVTEYQSDHSMRDQASRRDRARFLRTVLIDATAS